MRMTTCTVQLMRLKMNENQVIHCIFKSQLVSRSFGKGSYKNINEQCLILTAALFKQKKRKYHDMKNETECTFH